MLSMVVAGSATTVAVSDMRRSTSQGVVAFIVGAHPRPAAALTKPGAAFATTSTVAFTLCATTALTLDVAMVRALMVGSRRRRRVCARSRRRVSLCVGVMVVLAGLVVLSIPSVMSFDIAGMRAGRDISRWEESIGDTRLLLLLLLVMWMGDTGALQRCICRRRRRGVQVGRAIQRLAEKELGVLFVLELRKVVGREGKWIRRGCCGPLILGVVETVVVGIHTRDDDVWTTNPSLLRW